MRAPSLDEAPTNPLLARLAGFSLHAASVCEPWRTIRVYPYH